MRNILFIPEKLRVMLALDSPISLVAVHLYAPPSSGFGSCKYSHMKIYLYMYLSCSMRIPVFFAYSKMKAQIGGSSTFEVHVVCMCYLKCLP